MGESKRTAVLTILAISMILLAGCAIPFTSDGASDATPTPTQTPTPTTPAAVNDSTAPVGVVDGIAHDEALGITQSDGLTDAELQQVITRSMARVEHIRNTSFHTRPDIRVVTREEYQADNPFHQATDPEYDAFENLIWEAMFVVDSNTDASTQMDHLTNTAVQGYYLPSEDEIVVVTDNPDNVQVNELTLGHELVHALQDQRIGLDSPQLARTTRDGRLAVQAVIEGEASYIEHQYQDRCESADWECLEAPRAPSSSGGASNLAMHLLTYQPYSDGPAYIAQLVEQDGWAAVDHAFANPPETTAQTIHRESGSANTSFDTLPAAERGWTRLSTQGNAGAERLGEASVFAMLWYQSYAYDIETMSQSTIGTNDEYSRFDYSHPASDGLVKDEIVPYRKDGETAYVWRLEWESEQDASQFMNAYQMMLRGHDADRQGEYAWRLNTGGYSGSYYAIQEETRTTIVRAPTTKDIISVYPPAQANIDERYWRLPRPSGETTRTVGLIGMVVFGLVLLTKLGDQS